MKKQYIAPKITVIEIESQQLLAGSGTEISIGDGTIDKPVGAPGWDDDWLWDE